MLANIMLLHILPPVPDILATWTTPFFEKGTKVSTLDPNIDLTVSDTSNGVITLSSPGATARIQKADLYACKVRFSMTVDDCSLCGLCACAVGVLRILNNAYVLAGGVALRALSME